MASFVANAPSQHTHLSCPTVNLPVRLHASEGAVDVAGKLTNLQPRRAKHRSLAPSPLVAQLAMNACKTNLQRLSELLTDDLKLHTLPSTSRINHTPQCYVHVGNYKPVCPCFILRFRRICHSGSLDRSKQTNQWGKHKILNLETVDLLSLFDNKRLKLIVQQKSCWSN